MALAGKNYDWQTYPVIHLDMGSIRRPADDWPQASELSFRQGFFYLVII